MLNHWLKKLVALSKDGKTTHLMDNGSTTEATFMTSNLPTTAQMETPVSSKEKELLPDGSEAKP